ncbi:hypothetical protein CNR22_07920 [Sphingobacteriaceae bacterium]|nr:hypothetical protein CNR22_07920 [Sphingobacteriaceae bacterium]
MNRPPFLVLIFFLLCNFAFAQSKNNFSNTKDIFGTRVFIENKGQFDSKVSNGKKVLFAYENGPEFIYFTAEGPIYKFIKSYPLTEEQREEMEKGKKVNRKADKNFFVYVNWVNANKNLQVIESDKQSWYFSYGLSALNSYGYKKITYKNVYDHIDIEYLIPENKTHGIKYNVILHPYADPDQIKLLYSGHVKRITKKGKDVVVKTPLGNIVEHEPETIDQENKPVASEFSLKGDTLQFKITAAYNRNETLIIDPWVTTISNLANTNDGYDVNYDNAGNLYVYGGGSPTTAVPCKISKYSSTGTLLWTFPCILTSQNWNTAGLAGIPGNFTVNKITQKCYTGETFGSKIIRLDVNGNYDNFITAASNFWDELWEFDFDPCTQSVYAFGGGTSFNRHAAIVDEVNSTSIPVNLSGFTQTNQDVVCSTIDDNGDIFLVYVVPAPNFLTTPNYILKVNPAFNGNSWSQLTTYATLLEYSNKTYFSNLPQSITNPSSNGFNCIAVNANHLYYYDGFNVAVFDKLTGVKTASTNIPGYSPLLRGGIAVDDCDNVYLGGDSCIKVLHYNGTTFNVLPNIPLTTSGPQQRVYDLKLDRTTNILYASGRKFVGTYNATQICNTVTQIGVTVNCGVNNDAMAIASMTPSIPGSTLSYTLFGASGTISQGLSSPQTTYTLTNLPNGSYTLSVQTNAPCGAINSQTFSIDCPLCSISVSGSSHCIPSGISCTLTAFNPVNFSSALTYAWSGPGGYSSSLSQPTFTNGTFGNYTLTVTDGSCTAHALATLAPPPLPTLSAIANPSSGCVGQSVILTAISAGGTAPYTYNWNGGSSNSLLLVTPNTAGSYSYTVSVTDGVKCKASTTITLSVNDIPTVSAHNSTVCEGATIRLEASGAESYLWYPGPHAGNPYVTSIKYTSTFTVIGSVKGCTNSTTANVSMIAAPLVTLTALPQSGCEPMCINLSAASAGPLLSYNWLINNESIGTASAIKNYCFKGPGTYLINFVGTSFSGCTNLSAPSRIDVYRKPIANFTYNGELKLPEAEVIYHDASTSNVVNWYWYFGDGDSATVKDPIHVFPDAKIYPTFLIAKTREGCADTIGIPVKIDELPLLFLPNSFTPNGDGKNDTFFAKGAGVKDFKMSIYDRWGEKIFETNDITKSWDGTYKSKPVQEDSYTWLIIYTLENHRTETIAGHVTILR